MIHLPNPITVAAATETTMKTALTTFGTSRATIAIIDLDEDAKASLQTVNNIRYPYVMRTINEHAVNFPSVRPPFLDYDDAKTNFDTTNSLRELKLLLLKEIEAIDEISQIAEHNEFEYMRQFYDMAVQAQKAGTVPGIQSVIDDLKTLFDKTTVPPTPPPVV